MRVITFLIWSLGAAFGSYMADGSIGRAVIAAGCVFIGAVAAHITSENDHE